MTPHISIRYFHSHTEEELASRVFRFRKQVLIDEYGWELNALGDQERDEFDQASTVYCAVLRDDALIGSFRAINASEEYLAVTKFPQLATEQPYTRSSLSWEASRLVVASGERRFEASLLVYAAMFHFLSLQGGRSIVGFCDIAHERLLNRIGVTTLPYGPAATIATDRDGRPITVVAGEMPLPLKPSLKFQRLMSTLDNAEIINETSLLGLASLSA